MSVDQDACLPTVPHGVTIGTGDCPTCAPFECECSDEVAEFEDDTD